MAYAKNIPIIKTLTHKMRLLSCRQAKKLATSIYFSLSTPRIKYAASCRRGRPLYLPLPRMQAATGGRPYKTWLDNYRGLYLEPIPKPQGDNVGLRDKVNKGGRIEEAHRLYLHFRHISK